MHTRIPALAAVTTAAALLLSGCFGIESTTSSQPAVLGPVRLTTVACADGAPDCTAEANNGSEYQFLSAIGSQPGQDATQGSQVLYAVRLPDGATPPDSFTAVTASSTPLAMNRSASYEQQLQTAEPAGVGQRWWGYLSTAFTYSTTSDQKVTFPLDVTIGRATDGAPLASPLAWRSVVGARFADDTYPPSRPVVCVPAGSDTDTVYSSNDEDGYPAGPDGSIVCIDSPDQATTTGAPDQAPFVALALAGTPASAAAGSTGSLTFTARRSGSVAQSVALSATGGPLGSVLTPSTTTLPLSGPATSTTTVAATVPVNAKPGTYPITLTATAPGGRTETATAMLTVSGDTASPVLSKVRVALRKGVRRVAFTVSESTTVVVKVRNAQGKGVKKVTKRVGPGTSRAKLPKLENGRYKLQVKAEDAAGNTSKVRTKRFTVR